MVAARWLRFGCQLAAMVSVVQLVEHQVVILGVAGSSPVTHPSKPEGVGSRPAFYLAALPGAKGRFNVQTMLHSKYRSPSLS
jgi:hypothetical protein